MLCAFVWGATFPAVQAALQHASPLTLLGVRFLLAAAVIAVPAWKLGPSALRTALRWGLALGVVLALAFAAQTFGLARIGPSRSAFLTAFYVVFTPVCEWVLTRRPPARRLWLATLVTFVGGALMTGAGFGGALSSGDLWTLICAALFALHLVMVSMALARHDNLQILFLQVAVGGATCALVAPLAELPRFAINASSLALVFFLSVIATVGALWLQNYGQARTSATRAAVLFATEPVWAALFSYFAGDRLNGREILGASVVLTGVLLATLPKRTTISGTPLAGH